MGETTEETEVAEFSFTTESAEETEKTKNKMLLTARGIIHRLFRPAGPPATSGVRHRTEETTKTRSDGTRH
jgi:hypothetical protein